VTQFKELEDLLKRITEAGDELKTTLSQAHAARRDLTREVKANKELIVNTVVEEVARAVGQLVEEARTELHEAVQRVITGIEADWREKLGLDPR
jgi:hypothetical protein